MQKAQKKLCVPGGAWEPGSMQDGIYILGAGAHGRVVADILDSRGQAVTAFLDDDPRLHGKLISGSPVVGGCDLIPANPGKGFKLIVALGNAPLRLRLLESLQDRDLRLIHAVHRSAVISPSAWIGEGTCVCAGGVVNPGAFVGKAVIVNSGASVDHDCRIEDGAHLSPGVHLAGRVQVGRLTFLGTGACVIPRVRIGSNTIVGAGAVVVDDLPDGVLALGVPARIVRELAEPFDWSSLL